MCKPETNHTEPLRGAVSEIISGLSALNMQPDPIPPEEQTPDNNGYLSQTDRWVEHAYEHFQAAIQCIRKAENNTSFSSVKLLTDMLGAGDITDMEALQVLYDIKEARNTTPGYLRDIHKKYTQMMQED